MATQTLPTAFVWRRLHSLMGFWLVLFLCEHLLVNSQAALLLGENAQGFVRLVNSIHDLPYLQVLELILLGVPILVHGVWGLKYLFTSKMNGWQTDGSKPAMRQYGRNQAYMWQRLSSWVLLIGLVLHVAKFRFIEYPHTLNLGDQQSYFVTVSVDKGLYTVAARLGVQLFGSEQIQQQRNEMDSRHAEQTLVDVARTLKANDQFDLQQQMILTSAQTYEQKKVWVEMLEKQPIGSHQVVAVSSNFGTATLMTVRDTFKSPLYVGLYTIFVLAACFHAFNGLWTFLITWGAILRLSAQKSALKITWTLMVVVAFLGLAAIWGTYFLNLKT